MHEIERVLRADKVGGRYMLWIQWKGYQDPTMEPRKHILDQCNNPELLREIDAAVERYRAEHPRHVLDDVDADAAQDDPVASSPAGAELLGRGHRVRPVVRYFPETRRVASDSGHAVISMLHELYPS